MESTYKVYYFAGNGRAANIRALLTYAGANWENVAVAWEEWPALKATGKFEFGQMPGLEVDGKIKTQTIAIEIFLARKFGLIGSNEEEEYQIISLVASREDLAQKLKPLMWPSEEEKTRKEAIHKNIVEVDLPFLLGVWEKRFTTNSGKYFIGDKISLADIFVATSLKQLIKGGFSDAINTFAPKLGAHVESLVNGDLAKYFKDIHYNDSQF